VFASSSIWMYRLIMACVHVEANDTHQVRVPSQCAWEESKAAIAQERLRVQSLERRECVDLGRKYSDAEAVFEALDSDGTVLLRASWLRERSCQLLPKRGDDLPVGALIGAAELRSIYGKHKGRTKALPLLVISHFWRSKAHPDPDGETLRFLTQALDERWPEFQRQGIVDLGVFIDWSSLHQHPRTQEQEESFKRALVNINLWYAHRLTTCWLVTAGVDTEKGLGYYDKGWTNFERTLSLLIKPANTAKWSDWPQVVDITEEGQEQIHFDRPPPSEPLAFYGGHEHGSRIYTNGADRDNIVAPKFKEATFAILGGIEEFRFPHLRWSHAEICQLSVVLPLCNKLKLLGLDGNRIDADATESLVQPWIGGVLPALERLYLHDNELGDRGLLVLAHMLSQGGVPKLSLLKLTGNGYGQQGQHAVMDAATQSKRHRLKLDV